MDLSYGDLDRSLGLSMGDSAAFGEAAERDSADSIDELVKRNIQDVLQAANVHAGDYEDDTAPSTSQPAARPGLRPSSRQGLGDTGAAAGPARVSSAGRRRSDGPWGSEGGASTSGGGGGGAVLDVPGNADASLRLHKARIRGLEEELTKLTQALAERDKQLAEAKRDVKGLKTEQASWSKTQKTLEAQVEKLKRTAADAEGALASREAALKEFSREGSKVERERRQGDAEAKARDVRLQRALEEVDKYKQMLQEVKLQEREGKDVAKSEYHRVVAENKRLERQRAELIVAFKKQLKLIDVLKRQKLHLEAARALQFTEQEFLQTLEMGTS